MRATIDRVDYVDDAELSVAPSVMLQPPEATPASWATSPPWFDDACLHLPMGGFLVRSNGHLILVDAGVGPNVLDAIGEHTEFPVTHTHSSRMLQSLHALGASPDDVTDVVVTHLHADHVGWIAPHGSPIFPHARHHCHRADVNWLHTAGNANPAARGAQSAVTAVSDLLILAEDDRVEIADAVTLRLCAGHTPGNCIVEIATSDGPVLLLGDTAHHPALLVEEGWVDLMDEDREEAARSRSRIADELERTGAIGLGAHFPDHRGGRITRARDGKRIWTPVDVTAS